MDRDGRLTVDPRLLNHLVPMPQTATPHPQTRWLRPETLPRGIVSAVLILITLGLLGGEATARPSAFAHLRLPDAVHGRRPVLLTSDDGAVLERRAGALGVRAWAKEPGSCRGPAGQRAHLAAREAARTLLSEARFQAPTQLALVGTSEIDVRTRAGVACSVEIIVSHVKRDRR